MSKYLDLDGLSYYTDKLKGIIEAQSTVINGEKSKAIIGKDLTEQTLSGTYTLIGCTGSVTVTSGNFYLYNCSGLVVTNQNNAATVIRDGFAIGDYYFSANENPASKFGGYWEEIPNGTFLMAAGANGASDQTGGSADSVVVAHGHEVKTGPGGTYNNSYVGFSGGASPGVSPYASFAYESSLWGASTQLIAESSGVDGTGKNLPPYRTTHIYKRIANPDNSNIQ